MITADTLKTLTTFTAPDLTREARRCGYKGPDFVSCSFVGITNAGHFCYLAVFPSDPSKFGSTVFGSTKVFLDYNHTMDRVYVEVQSTELA